MGTLRDVLLTEELPVIPGLDVVGDLLVGYTDGLPEARKGGEILGIDRVRAELAGQEPGSSAASVAENLLAAAERFAGGALQDDAVVIAVRALE